MERHFAADYPCNRGSDVDARHARVCPRDGAWANYYQSLIRTMSHARKYLTIAFIRSEVGATFMAGKDFRKIAFLPGESLGTLLPLSVAQILLNNGAFAKRQAAIRLRNGTVTSDGSVGVTADVYKRACHVRLGQVPFHWRSAERTTFSSSKKLHGRLGKSDGS